MRGWGRMNEEYDKPHRYRVEDLKPGMIVSLSELSDIYETDIILISSTMDYSTGDPTGELLCVGYDPVCKNYKSGELVVIINHYDDDDIYDLDELD